MNNSEQNPESCQTDVDSNVLINTGADVKFIIPLQMIWQPKDDITTYELAKCLPYLLSRIGTMPYEIDKSKVYFRHFEIIDHNR
jgi:hypothetical protein